MKKTAHFCVGDKDGAESRIVRKFSISDNLAFIGNTAKEIVQIFIGMY